jgi:hypothetical protein
MTSLHRYRRVYLVDFEFTAGTGERPQPICCVVQEIHSGRTERHWLADGAPTAAPYDTGKDSLFVSYYASAELACHLALGWPMPERMLDLFAEFRCLTNGLPTDCGSSLLGALAHYGIDGLTATEKEQYRQLALRGGPFTKEEQAGLLDYCESDVLALSRLLAAMWAHIDLPRALLRGRYMAAAARMEWAGVPVDIEALGPLRQNWERIKHRLVAEVDRDYGVFVPAGQRTLDPNSALGAAILREAADQGLDPHQLAGAVDAVWEEAKAERAAGADVQAARRAARRITGLTAPRIARWEDSGRDYSDYPGLDVTARELAGEHPALGIGRGYETESGPDSTDHAALLWERLRQPDEPPKPKHHPDILRRAVELLGQLPPGAFDHSGPMTFSTRRFAEWLERSGIPWPRLASGAVALDDDTFREMAKLYPAQVGPIRELRHALSQMRLQELAVGSDGRNRCLLSAFRSRTGRNQPSNTAYIFGPSAWLRSLIKPGPGRAVAYCDWSAQELGIAAALSGDLVMQDAYRSGDPYLYLAKRAGAVPADATKRTHPAVREQFKVVSLGVLYGLSADGLARKLNVPPCRGRELLGMHQETFRRFWEWSEQVVMEGMLRGRLRTVFGWTLHVGRDVNPRSLRNFPMQAHGAEMLRLACCLATERGIQVCAPVHDALLVEGPAGGIDAVVQATQAAMSEASELVLPDFPLRTDARVVRYPERYVDERGRRMWELVCGLLGDLAEVETAAPDPGQNGWGTPDRMADPAPYLIPSLFLR